MRDSRSGWYSGECLSHGSRPAAANDTFHAVKRQYHTGDSSDEIARHDSTVATQIGKFYWDFPNVVRALDESKEVQVLVIIG
jgi:hypothetical protein